MSAHQEIRTEPPIPAAYLVLAVMNRSPSKGVGSEKADLKLKLEASTFCYLCLSFEVSS